MYQFQLNLQKLADQIQKINPELKIEKDLSNTIMFLDSCVLSVEKKLEIMRYFESFMPILFFHDSTFVQAFHNLGFLYTGSVDEAIHMPMVLQQFSKIPLETEDHMLFHINMLERITQKLPYAFLTRFLMRKYIKDKISYYGFEPEGMYMTHTMEKHFITNDDRFYFLIVSQMENGIQKEDCRFPFLGKFDYNNFCDILHQWIRSYIQDSQEMKETDTIQDLWNSWGEEDVKLLEFLKYFGNSKLKVESLERIVRQLPVLETDRKLCLEEKKR